MIDTQIDDRYTDINRYIDEQIDADLDDTDVEVNVANIDTDKIHKYRCR